MSIILLSGYKRSGKDYLFKILNKEIECYNNWYVFSNSINGKRNLINDNTKELVRLSLADKVKKEVLEIYGIPIEVKDKEEKIFTHYKTGEIISARDAWIEWSAIRKQEDQLYWVKVIIDKILPDKITVITDWRYEYEYQYLSSFFNNITTVRLFNPNVNIPTDESEVSLDNFTSDFLLVCSSKYEKKVIIPLKQYSKFNYIYKI